MKKLILFWEQVEQVHKRCLPKTIPVKLNWESLQRLSQRGYLVRKHATAITWCLFKFCKISIEKVMIFYKWLYVLSCFAYVRYSSSRHLKVERQSPYSFAHNRQSYSYNIFFKKSLDRYNIYIDCTYVSVVNIKKKFNLV